MKFGRSLPILVILTLLSFVALSTTLLRYTSEYETSDMAFFIKWNGSARDKEQEEFYCKGFSFDLFNITAMKPMTMGEKSFTFRSGRADTAIAYDIEINAVELGKLTTDDTKAVIATEMNQDVYAPFVFKVSSTINENFKDNPPVMFQSDWFKLQDVIVDTDGYFSIFDLDTGKPFFSPGSADEVTIIIQWQWNTSYFINDTEVQ